MRINIVYISFLLLSLCVLPVSFAEKKMARKLDKPHVLFIAVDDLRPELGCYGSPIVKSPNIDRLAREGVRFDRAYCQQAICSPSRASLMTGARPDTIGIIENRAYFRELNPDIVTLPQHFAKHGYEAFYSGKIYHTWMTDKKHSWTRTVNPSLVKKKRVKVQGGYANPENQKIWQENRKAMMDKYGKQALRGLIHGPAFEAGDVEDHEYKDGMSTLVAIETLKEHLQNKPDQPAFVALGFNKPHLHFIAPKRYWDMYDPADIKLASITKGPKDGMAVGLHPSFELRVRHGIPKYGPIPDDLARKLLHAYYACASYVDAQVGLMLNTLDELGIRDNTIVVFWGDHGWHLGDHGIWGKATNYEISTRVPLIISAPGQKVVGGSTDGLVELIDMYPTLCDLAGIPQPSHLEGKSLESFLNDPNATWDELAFSQFPSPALREWAANPLSDGMRETFFGPLIKDVEAKIKAQSGSRWDREVYENHLMGYTVRTNQHRLIIWVDYRNPSAQHYGVELYDHESDPEETVNVAQREENAAIVKELTGHVMDYIRKYKKR